MNRTAALALAGLTFTAAPLLVSVPAEAATSRVCAGTSGLRYDSDYRNGYSWQTVAKGDCKTWKSTAAWKAASGDRSMAVIASSGPSVKCQNSTVIRVGDPKGTRFNVASYDEKGCRNS